MTLSTAINSSFNNHTVNGNLANHNGHTVNSWNTISTHVDVTKTGRLCIGGAHKSDKIRV